MERKRVWTDVVRTALREAEADPPPGVWQRLEREREAGVAGLRQRRGLWWRFGAAAAAVVLCMVAGELRRLSDRAVGGREEMVEPTVSLLAAAAPVENAVAGAESLSSRSLAEPRRKGASGAVRAEKTAVATRVSEEPRVAAEAEDTARPAGAVAGQEQGRCGERPSGRAAAGAVRSRGEGELLLCEAPRARRKTAFGIFGGGAVSGGHTAPGAMTRSGMGMPVADENGVLTLDHRLRYESCSFRHRQPLSFGLTVRREFPYGLSIESGAVYTLLCSEATPAPGTSTIDQRLHFIGVPLRMNWRFLERNRFSLYIGAGGMVEKCVAATLGGRTVREPSVQWSAAAAVGAQYRLGDVVGLYFEPDLSYYFTRTELQTARTNSPLTFTLRLGVRFSF